MRLNTQKTRLPRTLANRLGALVRLVFKGDEASKKAFTDYHLVRRKFILSRTSEHFGKDKFEPAPLLERSLLDIGCGCNHMAEELAFRGADCTAIDINTTALEQARADAASKGSPVSFIAASAEDLVREEETYDIILCLDVLESTPNPGQLAWAISKLLAPGGVVILSVTSRSLRSWLLHYLMAEKLLKWAPTGAYRWRNMLSARQIQKLLTRHGLTFEHPTGVFFDLLNKEWRKTRATTYRFMALARKAA